MTGTMTAVLVDDEPLAVQILMEYLEAFPDVEVLGQCRDGFEAVKVISSLRPDLVFLDIQMPKLDGFEVLELLETPPSAVVFVTAYEQYALKAFDSHAVDYLLKPFSPQRLAAAMEKVRLNIRQGLPDVVRLRQVLRPEGAVVNRIVVRDGGAISVIPVGDILCICAEDDYVNILSIRGSVLKHQTLGSLEASLDPARFVRIHRSSVVNIERLNGIELIGKDRYVAVLEDGTELRISRSGHQRLKAALE